MIDYIRRIVMENPLTTAFMAFLFPITWLLGVFK